MWSIAHCAANKHYRDWVLGCGPESNTGPLWQDHNFEGKQIEGVWGTQGAYQIAHRGTGKRGRAARAAVGDLDGVAVAASIGQRQGEDLPARAIIVGPASTAGRVRLSQLPCYGRAFHSKCSMLQAKQGVSDSLSCHATLELFPANA